MSRDDGKTVPNRGIDGRPPVVPDPKYWFPANRYGWGWGLPGYLAGLVGARSLPRARRSRCVSVPAQKGACGLSRIHRRSQRTVHRRVLAERRADAMALGLAFSAASPVSIRERFPPDIRTLLIRGAHLRHLDRRQRAEHGNP